MVALLQSPELAFVDSNGAPLAGGTLATYTPGTTTPKTTWSDSGGTAPNANPVVLNAAGRCIVWGNGSYRMILKDASGNLIFDQVTSAVVSAAMAQVCLAPDVATARGLLGIVDPTAGLATAAAAMAAETAARAAGDSSLYAQLVAVNTNMSNGIAAELARASGVENRLWLEIPTWKVQGGFGQTDGDGHHRITFPAAFTTLLSVTATVTGTGGNFYSLTVNGNSSGVDVWAAYYSSVGPVPTPGLGFSWMAIGQ